MISLDRTLKKLAPLTVTLLITVSLGAPWALLWLGFKIIDAVFGG